MLSYVNATLGSARNVRTCDYDNVDRKQKDVREELDYVVDGVVPQPPQKLLQLCLLQLWRCLRRNYSII